MAIPEPRCTRIRETRENASRAARNAGVCSTKPKSRATLIENTHLPRVALGPWGSLVYPWWFGTTRLRFKSGRTHSSGFLCPGDRCPVSNESEDSRRIAGSDAPLAGSRSTDPSSAALAGVDGDVADHPPASIGDGPERHRPRRKEEHKEPGGASAREIVAVGRPVVDVREGVRRVILVEHRDPRGVKCRDVERARNKPGILDQHGNVLRGRDVVKRPRHRGGRQQVLIGEGPRRHGSDAYRHESDGREALEAVNPLGERSMPQYLASPEVADDSCGQR